MDRDRLNELLYQALETERGGIRGLPPVLPPSEEEKHVKTAIGADRARQAREEML